MLSNLWILIIVVLNFVVVLPKSIKDVYGYGEPVIEQIHQRIQQWREHDGLIKELGVASDDKNGGLWGSGTPGWRPTLMVLGNDEYFQKYFYFTKKFQCKHAVDSVPSQMNYYCHLML